MGGPWSLISDHNCFPTLLYFRQLTIGLFLQSPNQPILSNVWNMKNTQQCRMWLEKKPSLYSLKVDKRTGKDGLGFSWKSGDSLWRSVSISNIIVWRFQFWKPANRVIARLLFLSEEHLSFSLSLSLCLFLSLPVPPFLSLCLSLSASRDPKKMLPNLSVLGKKAVEMEKKLLEGKEKRCFVPLRHSSLLSPLSPSLSHFLQIRLY